MCVVSGEYSKVKKNYSLPQGLVAFYHTLSCKEMKKVLREKLKTFNMRSSSLSCFIWSVYICFHWISYRHLWRPTILLFCFPGLVSQKNEVNIMVKNAIDVIYGGLSYWLYGFAFSFGVDEGTNGFTGVGEMLDALWWMCVFDWSWRGQQISKEDDNKKFTKC